MTDLELKVRIFEAIAKNSRDMTDKDRYFTPKGIACSTNEVFKILLG